AEGNLHHGVDFWNGAAGEVSESKFLTNGRAGLAAIGSADQLKVNGSLSEGNREIGFYFSAVTGAEVSECEARKNQLGGMIFERESKRVKIDQNRVTQNGKVGIVIEKGVELLSNSANVVEKNEGKQMWNDAVFTPRADEETISPPPPPAPPVPEDEGKGDKESKEGE
ncbi:MAG: right-handed parallel beta-helix repeat-containing protein, partial [Akkermansiaceae bacterium]